MAAGEEVSHGYRVEGRVQGVGFRWWTRNTAMGLKLDGWVRNEADGAVVVHVRGPADAVSRLAEALRRGPSGARVDRVTPIPADGGIGTGEFRIER
jgi:acylphosphatase